MPDDLPATSAPLGVDADRHDPDTARISGLPLERSSAAVTDVGLIRPAMSVLAVLALICLLVGATYVREFESAVSMHMVRLLGGHDAVRYGSTVIFGVKGVLTGYTLTLGCTASFLVLPFFAATAALLVIRRVPIRRATLSLLLAVLVILVFNQLRLLTIAAGMTLWGPDAGYSRTHVLLGTLISTTGIITAAYAYLTVLLRGTFTRSAVRHG